MQVITYDNVASKILEIRNQKVILDSDIASLYNVETKRINEAVKNNPDKFPEGYLIELENKDKIELVENFDRFERLRHSTVAPKAFTEKGLYMLATILKSPAATATTIAIIDAFAQLKELTKKVYELSHANTEQQQVAILEQSVDIFVNFLDNELVVSQQETEFKIKLPFLEFTRKITKVKK
jgi:hypothetical protein